MKKAGLTKRYGFLLMAALIMVSLFSCSKKQGVSFISLLDEIDIYIQAGNTSDAVIYLQKAEKNAVTAFDEIGIYKRYLILGEKVKAEKWLIKSIKNHPDKLELRALYAHFLLEEERLSEALEKSAVLKESEYASLYAEAVLRYSKENGLSAEEVFNPPKKKNKKQVVSEEEKARCFYDPRFIEVYKYCYNATNNPLWIHNAASIYMGNGEYSLAASLKPLEMKGESDSYFWGIVLYDGGRYGESLEALLQGQEQWSDDEIGIKSLALCADDYYILGEDKASENLRDKLLAYDLTKLDFEGYESIIPIIYINSAIYNRNQGDIFKEYDTLIALVQEYPLYEPGLACYADFALETLRRPEEEELYRILRIEGLKTQGMEYNDSLPKISIDEAFERIDTALLEKKNPELVVLREELYAATQENLSPGAKVGRLWSLLEKNEKSSAAYPPEIVRYVLTNLVLSGDEDEARELFANHLKSEYGITMEDAADAEMTRLSLWEYEACAWFLKDNDVSRAWKIYEFIVKRFSERYPGIVTQGQNDSVVNALVNLSVIYGGYGDNKTSLEMLNSASGKCNKVMLKAEILYRMGEVYALNGDGRNAARTLKYAISLNPSHYKARLLLKTVTSN